MVNISIDVTDLGGEARPGDKVVLWKPAAAGSATHAGRIISTAPVTVRLVEGIKYDPLGGNGAPDSPGIWIGINEQRQEPITRLEDFPATVADLDEAEKSRLLAELQTWQNGQIAKEADSGN